ncbi:hypothetical protein ACWF62_13915 [Rhodococcus sp. NPDC054953]
MKKHPVLATIGALVALGLIVKFWYLVVVGLAIFAGVKWWQRHQADQAAIVARADAQHQAYLAGDDFGLYGFHNKAEEI